MKPRVSPVSSTVFGGFGMTETRILRVSSIKVGSFEVVSFGRRRLRKDLPRKDRPRHVFQEEVVPDGRGKRDPRGNGQIEDIGPFPEAAHFQIFHAEGGRPPACRFSRLRRQAARCGKEQDHEEYQRLLHCAFPSFAVPVPSRSSCAISRRFRIGTARSEGPSSSSSRSRAPAYQSTERS